MSDPYWSNVTFLGGFEGTLPTDESPLAQTVTVLGGGTSATQAKYGSKSLDVSGSALPATKGISVPDNAAFFSGTTSFTIEGWIYLSSYGSGNMIIAAQGDAKSTVGTASWAFALEKVSTHLRMELWSFSDGTEFTQVIDGGNVNVDPSLNAWHHYAVDFNGSKYRFYFDGTMVDSSTASRTLPNSSAPLTIGYWNYNSAADWGFDGYIDELRITSGVARYASDSGFTVPTAAYDRVNPLDTTLTETLNLTELLNPGGFAAISETTNLTEGAVGGWLRDATDTIGVTPLPDVTLNTFGTAAETTNLTTTLDSTWGYVASELVNLIETLTPAGVYNLTASQILALTEQASIALPASLAETLNLTDTLGVLQGLVLAEQLGFAETYVAALVSQRTAAEVLALTDSLANFFSGDATETVNLTETMVSVLQANALVTDVTTLSETITPQWLLRVDAAEAIELSPSLLLQGLWQGTLSETLQLTGGYLAPNGSFTTWVMNARTGAVTEYDNFAFNSFARMGNKYLAASSTGLYELTGDTDAGADIISRLKGGFMQFGGAHLSRLKEAYIAARGEGRFVLKITTGDGETYTYQTDTRDMRSTKVHMGKGQRARYFAFELTSAGQDFDLESLEFVPIAVQRRV